MNFLGLTDKKMLAMLYTNLVIFTVGIGLFPILPLYTAQLGLDRGMIGIFFGVIYLANATGAMSAGFLSTRIPRRQLFIAAGIIGAPAIALLGQTQAVALVALFSAIAWFAGGMLLSLINVYIGQHAEGNNRGKSFSLTMLAIPLGSLIGGTVVGQMIVWKGYEVMFATLGLLWTSHILVGVFALKGDQAGAKNAKKSPTANMPVSLGRSFYLLLALSLLTATAINASRLGTPLAMQALEYSAKDVASSATLSGLAAIPLTMLVGILSDRLGRKGMLVATYLIAAGGALVLSLSSELWQFWLAASLMMVSFVSSSAMAAAMATDLLDPEALARGLPWINSVTSLTGILAFAGTGYMMDIFGARMLFMGMSLLPVAATALLEVSIRKPAADIEVEAVPCREATLVREGVWVSECM